jgi:hypothetical protein
MKGPKEIKNWLNKLRKHYGKKNGVINGWFLDSPRMENKADNSKKNYIRCKIKKKNIE